MIKLMKKIVYKSLDFEILQSMCRFYCFTHNQYNDERSFDCKDPRNIPEWGSWGKCNKESCHFYKNLIK